MWENTLYALFFFAHFREKVIKKSIDILLLEERKHSF